MCFTFKNTMYGDFPSVTKCCFCVPLRPGLLMWAYIKLITNIMLFIAATFWSIAIMIFSLLFGNILPVILMIAMLLILLFEIIFNVVFIVGANKKNTTMLRLYYRYGIAHSLMCLVWGLIFIGDTLARNYGHYGEFGSWRNVVIFASGLTAFLILHFYLLLLIRTEVQKLKATADFRFVNLNNEPTCSMAETIDIQIKEENNEEMV